jgi:DNA-binding CsgD family transcriptional regulator
VPRLSRAQQTAYGRIRDLAAMTLPVERLAAALMAALRQAIPVDGYRLFGLDPATRLVNRVLAASDDDGWARLEYLQSVYLAQGPTAYAELSNVLKAGLPVAAFHDRQALCWGYARETLATMSPSEHYRYYHEMNSPLGGGIQAVFAAHGRVIAALQVYRRDASSQFRASEVSFLALVRPLIGQALGAALARERALRGAGHDVESSGVLILDERGGAQFATPDGERWRDRLMAAEGANDGSLPTAVLAALAALRSGQSGAGALHAETPAGPVRVEATRGGNGESAVVLTPVRALAPPEVPAEWPLTEQEREVVKLVLRGARNREIAAALSISENTVESHLRHIYARLEVDGRGQVLARFFRETFYPGIESETST